MTVLHPHQHYRAVVGPVWLHIGVCHDPASSSCVSSAAVMERGKGCTHRCSSLSRGSTREHARRECRQYGSRRALSVQPQWHTGLLLPTSQYQTLNCYCLNCLSLSLITIVQTGSAKYLPMLVKPQKIVCTGFLQDRHSSCYRHSSHYQTNSVKALRKCYSTRWHLNTSPTPLFECSVPA